MIPGAEQSLPRLFNSNQLPKRSTTHHLPFRGMMDTVQLDSIDRILVVIYLIGIISIGLYYSKSHKGDTANYLLASRRISLPAFVATLVSTWYGGILGIGEFTYRFGLLNWVTQALPYYIFAVLFALLLASRIRQTNLFTIPDQLYANYNKSTGITGSIFIFFLITPAPHFLILTLLLQLIFQIPLWTAILCSVIFSALYVYWGGFKSVVATDILQFLLMFVGFVILTVSLIARYGGFFFLQSHLPTTHLTFHGGQSWQYILVWFFIALCTFVDPGFYQRCYAARTPQTARNGILVAVLFWFFFDFLTTLTGLYSRALFPEIDPLTAFPLLGDAMLPAVFKGLFFISLLATAMSTLDSNAFISATTFGRDILWRIRRKGNINRYTQLGLIISILLSILLILAIPSIVRLWYLLGSLFIPSLLLPLMATFFPVIRLPSRHTLRSMRIAFGGTLTWLLAGVIRGSLSVPRYWFEIQPFFTGLVLSLGYYLVVLLGNPKSKNES